MAENEPAPKRRSRWFPVAITFLIVAFLVVVVMRDRIRAHWWAYRLTHASAPQERGHYLALLGTVGPAGWSAILNLLNHEQADIRCLAIFAVKSSGNEKADEVLHSRMCQDRDTEVRNAAAIALAFIADEISVKRLKNTAISAEEGLENGALAATAALARVPASDSCTTLVEVLSIQPSPLISAQAAESLGSLLLSGGSDVDESGVVLSPAGNCDVISALIASLADGRPFTGELAIEREIRKASEFVVASGKGVDDRYDVAMTRTRTVADIAAEALSELTGNEISPVKYVGIEELDRLTQKCRAGYAERHRKRSESMPTTTPALPGP